MFILAVGIPIISSCQRPCTCVELNRCRYNVWAKKTCRYNGERPDSRSAVGRYDVVPLPSLSMTLQP